MLNEKMIVVAPAVPNSDDGKEFLFALPNKDDVKSVIKLGLMQDSNFFAGAYFQVAFVLEGAPSDHIPEILPVIASEKFAEVEIPANVRSNPDNYSLSVTGAVDEDTLMEDQDVYSCVIRFATMPKAAEFSRFRQLFTAIRELGMLVDTLTQTQASALAQVQEAAASAHDGATADRTTLTSVTTAITTALATISQNVAAITSIVEGTSLEMSGFLTKVNGVPELITQLKLELAGIGTELNEGKNALNATAQGGTLLNKSVTELKSEIVRIADLAERMLQYIETARDELAAQTEQSALTIAGSVTALEGKISTAIKTATPTAAAIATEVVRATPALDTEAIAAALLAKMKTEVEAMVAKAIEQASIESRKVMINVLDPYASGDSRHSSRPQPLPNVGVNAPKPTGTTWWGVPRWKLLLPLCVGTPLVLGLIVLRFAL